MASINLIVIFYGYTVFIMSIWFWRSVMWWYGLHSPIFVRVRSRKFRHFVAGILLIVWWGWRIATVRRSGHLITNCRVRGRIPARHFLLYVVRGLLFRLHRLLVMTRVCCRMCSRVAYRSKGSWSKHWASLLMVRRRSGSTDGPFVRPSSRSVFNLKWVMSYLVVDGKPNVRRIFSN